MILTEDLFKKGKESKKICTVLNDDYVLLNKVMPVYDQELETYLNNIKRAYNSGINISYVEAYRLIDSSTHTYSNGSYTKGVFLEKRAKGNNMDSVSYYNIEGNDSLREYVDDYLKQSLLYLEELEKRAKGDFFFYDKLVRDSLDLRRYGLMLDPKPTNFFYDEKDGFTIIDTIPYNEHDKIKFFPLYMINAIYGYGRPLLYYCEERMGLPEEYAIRFKKVYDKINRKLMMALRKNSVSELDIMEIFEKEVYKIDFNDKRMEREEMVERLEQLMGAAKHIR